MAKVLQFPEHIDISPLRQALWAHRINHHYREEQDQQLIFLMDEARLDDAVALTERFRSGQALTLDEHDAETRSDLPASNSARQALRRAAFTALTIALCAMIYVMMSVASVEFITAFTIVPMTLTSQGLEAGTLSQAFATGQFWRLLSPVFLHFGWMHLVFNMVWLWYFGRQVEEYQGRLRFLALVVASGVFANLAQYMTGTLLFGGMSGVIYALMGYVWLWSRVPDSRFEVPTALVLFMVGWMVLCMTPLAGAIGFPNVANEAHLGGLFAGLIIGKLTLLARKPTDKRGEDDE
ncbi:rhomboid family intramembrane serine protease [Larsenimonas salina]|uniref:rhomboid family intramembrane serine protease n=1 Tax=Larsenimonas salina TaxID=1295565 RepID=UPI002072BAD4|nr:rhomboid family intramembrane serine protease [Larsenimonas salina]MCM5703620.1 rhomboid family intramembrane serine protease [Larsenimonas salina]